MAKRIATSPLTGRIHLGRVNTGGTAFVGEKQDVTSDVLKSVIEKAVFHGGTFEIANGDFSEVWDVKVTKRQPTNQQLEAAFNNACLLSAFGDDASNSAIQKLRLLRDARTTWFGSEELNLRIEIDRLINEQAQPAQTGEA